MVQARVLFEEIDEDGGGALDREEIRILAKRLGKKLSNDKLDAAMAEMDEDGNGDVCTRHNRHHSFPGDGDGSDRLIALFDQLQVDFEEFVKWWKATGSKGFFGEVLSFGWLKKKKETETVEEKAELLKNEEETYLATPPSTPPPHVARGATPLRLDDDDTFKRKREEAGERIEQQKMENAQTNDDDDMDEAALEAGLAGLEAQLPGAELATVVATAVKVPVASAVPVAVPVAAPAGLGKGLKMGAGILGDKNVRDSTAKAMGNKEVRDATTRVAKAQANGEPPDPEDLYLLASNDDAKDLAKAAAGNDAIREQVGVAPAPAQFSDESGDSDEDIDIGAIQRKRAAALAASAGTPPMGPRGGGAPLR